MRRPLISVVLPVYNGSRYLTEAIESILCQTFEDYELIIIDDGSTDDSLELIKSVSDRRIRVHHQDNKGLAGTLNVGISLSNGDYIARMDQDDLALPTRLEKQVIFMEDHPKCALLGTRAEIWVGDRRTDRVHDHPTDNLSLRFELMFDNYFVHSSVMLRKSAIEDVGGYTTDPHRQPPEDYELWSRLARKYDVANLAERLTIYREVGASMSRITSSNPFLDKLIMISAENIAHELGADKPSVDMVDVAALTHSAFHHLSGHPNLKRMCTIVKNAGREIHSNGSSSDILERMEARIQTLRHKHLLSHYNAGRLRPVIRILHGIRRRFKF